MDEFEENTEFAVDEGLTDSRALWGDLLIQLREYFRGELWIYE